jgi:hypothetical protein
MKALALMVTLACDASTGYVEDDEDERHQEDREKRTSWP